MINKKNLIVFDIDGTLTDTVKLHQDAFKKSIQLIGVKKFNDSFGTYKHHTDSFIAKEIFEKSEKQTFKDIHIEKFENHLFEIIKKEKIREIKGSRSIINKIENQTNFGICYATGSLFKPAKFKLESIGIKFNPNQLVASNQIEEREEIVKKAILNAQKFYNVEKFERIISIGDGIWDLKTAENLSIEFIGIGLQNETSMRSQGMKRHYTDFQNLEIADL